ncbi:MAG: protein kinase, partial [Planctomycetaceae bacterium]|nr:protein kinase [Planctomycetaceae bacterium]
MAEQPDHHPTDDQLLAFAEGRLAKEAADRIAEHVELCDPCANQIDSVTVTAESALFSQDQPTSDRSEPPSFTTAVTEVPELLKIIGSGGMGVVWRARQSAIGRDVAVKLLHIPMPQNDAESHRAAERFQREIRALGSVQHPHLARIYSSGISDEGRLFYSMELIDGANLSMVFRALVRQSESQSKSESGSKFKSPEDSTSSQYSWAAAVAEACRRDGSELPESGADGIPEADSNVVKSIVTVIRQVALAVQALHDAGIVHRDIKPGNIMVNVRGDHATLMDLGLAGLADDQETRLTRTGLIAGSLPYVSPEQFRGEPPSKSGDIYNLGAVLWELLTLRKLFQATEECSEAELLHRILHQEPEAVCRFRLDVSRDLDAVVLKCLEKQPTNRYSDVGELIADLDCCLAGEPVSAARRGTVFRMRRHLKRHRMPVLSGLLLLAGQVLLFVVLAGSSADRTTQPPSSVNADGLMKSGAAFASPPVALPAAVINDGSLVAWWSAEGTTSAVPDRSPNGNNGALVGNASRAAGIFGKAFSFDGDGDYISFGRSSKWNFLHDGSPFSVTGFVAPSASNPDGGILTTIDETSTAAQRHGFGLRLDGSRRLQLYVQGSGGPFPLDVIGSSVLTPDVFTAVAVTFDGSEGRVYINGQL